MKLLSRELLHDLHWGNKTYKVKRHLKPFPQLTTVLVPALDEGGVRVCGDAVLRYFWGGFAVIFISTRGIAVSKH